MVVREEEGSFLRPREDFEQGKVNLGEWVGFSRQERRVSLQSGKMEWIEQREWMSVRQESGQVCVGL